MEQGNTGSTIKVSTPEDAKSPEEIEATINFRKETMAIFDQIREKRERLEELESD